MIRKLSLMSLLFITACQSPSPEQKPDKTAQQSSVTPSTTVSEMPAPKAMTHHPITLFNGAAMGIDYNVTIGKKLTKDQARQVIDIITATFDEVNAHYNNWNPSSEISKLNQLPAGQIVLISPGLERLFEVTNQAYVLSEGRFDPTVDPLVTLWKKKLRLGMIPSNQEIAALMPNVGWEKIHVSRGHFCKDVSELSIDFCGISKGYALDILVEKLNASGYPDAFLEWGGEIRAIGQHPDQRQWVAGISAIPDLLSDPLADVEVSNRGIATSGSYQQYWLISEPSPSDPSKTQEITFTHIIDPKTGQALSVSLDTITSTTVLASSCALADGLATAAMVFKDGEGAQVWADRLQEKDPSLKFWIITQNIEELTENTQF